MCQSIKEQYQEGNAVVGHAHVTGFGAVIAFLLLEDDCLSGCLAVRLCVRPYVMLVLPYLNYLPVCR